MKKVSKPTSKSKYYKIRPYPQYFFLIYIRNLFQDLENRGINYINDISLVASLKLIKENYKILKKTAIRIFEKKATNLI